MEELQWVSRQQHSEIAILRNQREPVQSQAFMEPVQSQAYNEIVIRNQREPVQRTAGSLRGFFEFVLPILVGLFGIGALLFRIFTV
jgi:hypothetical protein